MSKILIDKLQQCLPENIDAETGIYQQNFSLAALPKREQLEFWQAFAAEFVPNCSIGGDKHVRANVGFAHDIQILALQDYVLTISEGDFVRYHCQANTDEESQELTWVLMMPLTAKARNLNDYADTKERFIAPYMIYFADNRYSDVSEMWPGRSLSLRFPLSVQAFVEEGEAFPSPFMMTMALQSHPLYGYLRRQLINLADFQSEATPMVLAVMLEQTVALVRTILHELVQDVSSRKVLLPKQGRYERYYYLAEQFITSNLHRPLSIEEIAQAACCSRATLHRAFADRELTVTQFANEKRLMKLRNLLSDPAHIKTPLSQLSEMCGFSSATYAGQLFKRYYQLTMSEWRDKAFVTAQSYEKLGK